MNLDSLGWTLLEATSDEGSFLVRYRHFPKDWERTAFPQCIKIVWMMSDCLSNGMPQDVESDRMRVFEDRIVEAVEPDGQSALALVVTGRRVREYVFYTRQSDEFMKRLSAMPQELERYPISIHHRPDPAWQHLDQLLSEIGAD